jgi:hypothetical protein
VSDIILERSNDDDEGDSSYSRSLIQRRQRQCNNLSTSIVREDLLLDVDNSGTNIGKDQFVVEASDSSNSELRDLSGCISADPGNGSGFTARLDILEQANLVMSRKNKFKRAGDGHRF